MKPQNKTSAGIAGFVLLFLLYFVFSENPKPAPQVSPIVKTDIWTTPQNAIEHFQKHGEEFTAKTVDAYIGAAHDFVTRPPQGTLTTKQQDGDTVYFHPSTGRFAVVRQDGKIRTYFVREENLNGYKSNMQYFNEQAGRK